MSRPALIFYWIVLAVAASISVYALWWWDDWIAAALAVVATSCVLIPIFAAYEAVQENRILEVTREREKAHTRAGAAYLQRVREIDAERLAQARLQDSRAVTRLLEENSGLRTEIANLTAKLLPFTSHFRDTATGKFVSAKPKQKALGKRMAGALEAPQCQDQEPKTIEGKVIPCP